LSLVTRALGRSLAAVCSKSLQGFHNQGFRRIPVDFLHFVTQRAKAWRRSVACMRAFDSGAMAALSYAAAGGSNSSSYSNRDVGGGGVSGNNSNSTEVKYLGESKPLSALSVAAASPSQSNSRRSLRFSNATGDSIDAVRSAYPPNNTMNLF
jgi:hypothetical protein